VNLAYSVTLADSLRSSPGSPEGPVDPKSDICCREEGLHGLLELRSWRFPMPGSASPRLQMPPHKTSPCTHLSTRRSQQDHEGPLILGHEIRVVSLLCFNETLFILGF